MSDPPESWAAAWLSGQQEFLKGWPQAAQALWEALQAGGSLPPGFGPPASAGIDQALSWPALGITREDQLASQKLLQLAARVAEAQTRLGTTWTRILGDAERTLRERVAERAAAGQPLASVRALYDLWVEVAEAEYGQAAPENPYAQQQAELTNALSELRIAQRESLERWLRSVDLPTRTELDSVHRQLRELTLSVRSLEARLPAASPAVRQRKTKPTAKPAARSQANAAPKSNAAPKPKATSRPAQSPVPPPRPAKPSAASRAVRRRRDRP